LKQRPPGRFFIAGSGGDPLFAEADADCQTKQAKGVL